MTEHTTSYYAASANRYEPFPTLDESISCDVCVVGGGYTGLSSALHLAEMGYDVVLLESARIGFGASGRNGGQLVNSYSRDIDVIEKTYGPDAARMLGSMMFEGGEIIRERIQRYQIQCDYRPGGLFVAMNHKQLETLEEQKDNWQRYGNNQLELLDAADQAWWRLHMREPVSENPMLTFELPAQGPQQFRLKGQDNNGNRIDAQVRA